MEDERDELCLDFEIRADLAGQRLDTLIPLELERIWAERAQQPSAGLAPSRSKASRWISEGRVEVNDEVIVKPSYRPREGFLVTVNLPPPRKMELSPDALVKFEIVHEEDSFLVLNKPPGLVVHPGAGHFEGTLVHGLLSHLGEGIRAIGDCLRPGLVHRLDKDTSGLMVVAKTEAAFQGLSNQFLPPRTCSRVYLALCTQAPRQEAKGSIEQRGQGVIEAPIARDARERKKMAVASRGGREAKTSWRVVEARGRGCVLELSLDTGRTHQIRVHLSSMGAPIVGDPLYGKGFQGVPPRLRERAAEFGRQALHAGGLSFLHPLSRERVSFEAQMPKDMAKLIEDFLNYEG